MRDASIGCHYRSYSLLSCLRDLRLLLWPACRVLRLHCSHFSRVSCISGSDFLHVISFGVGGTGGAFCCLPLRSSLFIDRCVVFAPSSLLLLFFAVLSSQMRLMAPSVILFILRIKDQKSCWLLSLLCLGLLAVFFLLGSVMRYIQSAVKLSLSPCLHSVVACRAETFIYSEACITRISNGAGFVLGVYQDDARRRLVVKVDRNINPKTFR